MRTLAALLISGCLFFGCGKKDEGVWRMDARGNITHVRDTESDDWLELTPEESREATRQWKAIPKEQRDKVTRPYTPE